MTGASKRSKRNRAPAIWSLSLLFCGLLAMLPAAGAQAASSDEGMLLAGGLDQLNGPMTTAEYYNFKTAAFSCKLLGGVNSATGACKNSLATARFYASVAPLSSGGVLIAGGNSTGVTCLNSAEIYDPSTGRFTPTATSMTDAHCFAHTTTVLTNGWVLITGGEDTTGNIVNTADMYNPATGFTCSTLGGVSATTGYCTNTMTDVRFLDTATLLKNGSVLIAGGNDGSIVNTAELFNPVAGTFTATGPMTDSRENHTAALIVTGANSGDVLIAGGIDALGNVVQTAELYSPTAGTFAATGSMTHPRYLHTATQLSTGKILITGGEDGTGAVLASAEVYDPVAATFASVGSMSTARALHTAVLITSGPKKGSVLIAGGIDNNGNTLGTAELFNPKTGNFTAAGSMEVGRSSQDGTALK